MSKWQEFWDLTELHKRSPDDAERILAGMPESKLVDLYWMYEETAADVKDEEFTQHMEPPPSEDVLDDVALWIVSQGLDHYESIMMNPSKMPSELPPDTKLNPWVGTLARIYRKRYNAPVRFKNDPPPNGS